MPAPLPKELRDRFTRLIEEGLSGREASRRLQLSAATGARWRRQIHMSGVAAVAPMGRPPGSGKLAAHARFFRELVSSRIDDRIGDAGHSRRHACRERGVICNSQVVEALDSSQN